MYVSFSGGKDSTVLKHIVDDMYDDIPAVFVNTGLEYPEIQTFVREIKAGKYACFNPDVEIIRPEMRFDEVIREYGYPVVSKTISKKVGTVQRNGKECKTHDYFKGTAKTKDGKPSMFNCQKWAFLCDAPFKIDNFCCEIMKKAPFKAYEAKNGRKPIVGTMASESKMREAVWYRRGCNIFSGAHSVSQPLSFWTNQDVLQYLLQYNVPYCPVYGEIVEKGQLQGQERMFQDQFDELTTTGESRTGCMFCMYGCHMEGSPNRFQRLKQTHPKQWAYCVGGGEFVDGVWQPNKEGLGLAKVMEYVGIPWK